MKNNGEEIYHTCGKRLEKIELPIPEILLGNRNHELYHCSECQKYILNPKNIDRFETNNLDDVTKYINYLQKSHDKEIWDDECVGL